MRLRMLFYFLAPLLMYKSLMRTVYLHLIPYYFVTLQVLEIYLKSVVHNYTKQNHSNQGGVFIIFICIWILT